MIKAELINVGRNNVNKTIEVKSVSALHKEIGKHIISRGWGLDQTENENVYEVVSGFRIVGTVKILSA